MAERIASTSGCKFSTLPLHNPKLQAPLPTQEATACEVPNYKTLMLPKFRRRAVAHNTPKSKT